MRHLWKSSAISIQLIYFYSPMWSRLYWLLLCQKITISILKIVDYISYKSRLFYWEIWLFYRKSWHFKYSSAPFSWSNACFSQIAEISPEHTPLWRDNHQSSVISYFLFYLIPHLLSHQREIRATPMKNTYRTYDLMSWFQHSNLAIPPQASPN